MQRVIIKNSVLMIKGNSKELIKNTSITSLDLVPKRWKSRKICIENINKILEEDLIKFIDKCQLR
jgi:hypothetical protein